LEPSSECATRAQRLRRIAVVFVACTPLLAFALPAQQLTNRIQFDSLQLSALALDVGRIQPTQTEGATVFGIAADYGKLSRTLRLRFEAGYWESRLTDEVVRTFIDSLHKIINDPSKDDVIRASGVSLYDITMGVSARYLPMQTALFQPFVGLGAGIHVFNAQGPLVDGTFVERLLDNISAGLFAETGVLFKPLQRIGVEGRVRGDLVNGFRALSVRVGGVYYFGPLRRTDQ
jgi:hypothetical protein